VVPTERIKLQQRTIIARFNRSNDYKGSLQLLTTLLPLAFIWWIAVLRPETSGWLTVGCIPLISLFSLRVFALMHECGHGSLFQSPWLNRGSGFVLGVISGMPQYVWSQHHNYHHAHNGNWEKYRGPYATPSVREYEAMSVMRQRLYRLKCSVGAAPLVGFIYLIFNPRFTWLKGSIGFLVHVVGGKLTRPTLTLRQHAAAYRASYWKTLKEYRHMFWNNVVLLALWALMCWLCGATLFFTVYLVSLSIAGGAGVILFTVQHNFEHSYAADCGSWDYTAGAIRGTSFLVLPRWLNWFTVDIGYHHIHHLSAKIPNYCLVQCHDEYQHLFVDVTRVKLSQLCKTLKYILWDDRAQRIISILEYQQQSD
jgi:omega-6 fatty acid desaturase (delta-12 desaturase)